MEYPETLMSDEQIRAAYAKLLEINFNEIAENIRLTVRNAELLAALTEVAKWSISTDEISAEEQRRVFEVIAKATESEVSDE